MDVGEALAGLTFAAGVVTVIVKFFRQAFDAEATAPPWAWSGAAIVLGVVLAVVYGFNALKAFGVETRAQQLVGQILTGFMIAFESGVIHVALKRVNPDETDPEHRADETRRRRNPAGH